MADLSEELCEIAGRCEEAAARLADASVTVPLEKLRVVLLAAATAASGSWLGYHASTYIRDLRPRGPADVFDAEWPTGTLDTATRGDWVTYDALLIEKAFLERSKVEPDTIRKIAAIAVGVGAVFDIAKSDLVALLDALLDDAEGSPLSLREARTKLIELEAKHPAQQIIGALRPRNPATRDRAAASGGVVAPPHVEVMAHIEEIYSYGRQVIKLASIARQAEKYLKRRKSLEAPKKPNVWIRSRAMAKKNGSWDPKSFEEVLAALDSKTMHIALGVVDSRSCPAPKWD